MTTPIYECRHCGPLHAMEYSTDHRCRHCSRPIVVIQRQGLVAVSATELREIAERCSDTTTRQQLEQLIGGRA